MLTRREVEICELLCEGLGNKTVAERLGISPGTVGSHLKAIHVKLGTHSRGATVAKFLRSSRVQDTAFAGYRSIPRRATLRP
ncbi:MAG: response regulator transcription factor [Verrucomicrobia bacterium]|nr:response regulator transcription factor [Verrucomicrobiota bacterium]